MDPNTLHILLAEDDDVVRTTLTESLLLNGYAVHGAASGEEALEILRSRRIDLVIADLMMPGMSGVELIEEASRVYPQLPFLVLSAFGTTDLARESIQRGAVDFLSKPITTAELVIAIERNLERQRVEAQRRREATAEILFETVQAFAAAIDLLDPYTAGHSHRVADLADRMAVAAGLSEEERWELRLASVIHDVGKLFLPPSILRKPGRLEPDEWAEVRKHPSHGCQVVSHIMALGRVAALIRHHHENVDGSGYPDGLEGEAIPLAARILAVADAYEALTSNRSYREALSRQEAFRVLQQEAGHRYDSAVVRLLIEVESADEAHP
ncbi:MAG: response regulator [Armatimonadota bacterium]|nr:response regulator [Armatimonadota bacterium]